MAAYDVPSGHGFSFLAVPNTRRGIDTNPYDRSELLVRLVEWNSTAVGSALPSAAPQYFSVTSPDAAPPGGPWEATVPRRLTDGGMLYANLIEHLDSWDTFFAGGMQVELAYNRSEGARLVDMSRSVSFT